MARSRIPHEVDTADIEKNATTPEIEAFAKTFNSLLIEKKIHQDDLAKAVGISTGSISAYRNGKKEPRLSMIVKIADYLGIDCHYLMTGTKAEYAIAAKEIGLDGPSINYMYRALDGHPERGSTLNILLRNYSFYRLLTTISQSANTPNPQEEIFEIPSHDRFSQYSSEEVYKALTSTQANTMIVELVDTLKGGAEHG